jgi:hypothetical protein
MHSHFMRVNTVLNRLKLALVGVFIGVAVPATVKATSFAFTGPVNRSGDTNGPVEIANDFTVTATNGINVTQLGLFIDGYDGVFVSGPGETHKVALFNRGTGQLVTSVNISGSNINTVDGPFAYTSPGSSNSFSPQVQGAFGYVNIPSQLLPNGFQGSIVAYTLSDGGAYIDDYGEGATFNSGGSLVSFTHSFLASTSSTSGDPTTGSSTTPRGAGSFTFAAASATPEPASLSVLLIGAAICLKRRRC